ncbi:hypothetical protein F4774DRAFT_155402 [Daldinia eschscholtzii]|nr:hypothetical protein F4774DRAFT_155402 [Daldinia eschscholtzii]
MLQVCSCKKGRRSLPWPIIFLTVPIVLEAISRSSHMHLTAFVTSYSNTILTNDLHEKFTIANSYCILLTIPSFYLRREAIYPSRSNTSYNVESHSNPVNYLYYLFRKCVMPSRLLRCNVTCGADSTGQYGTIQTSHHPRVIYAYIYI